MKKIFEFSGSAELYQIMLNTPEVMKQLIAEAGGKSGNVMVTVDDGVKKIDEIDLALFGQNAEKLQKYDIPDYTIDDLRFGEKVENLDTQFDGADEMMGQKVDDGWVQWKGGACPVSLRDDVEVRLLGGHQIFNKAKFFRWDHIDDVSDIVAYRIIKNDSDVHGC